MSNIRPYGSSRSTTPTRDTNVFRTTRQIGETTVPDKVHRSQYRPPSTRTCGNYGCPFAHKNGREFCPARGIWKECASCGKIGHFTSGLDLPQDTRADRPQEKNLFIMCHIRPHRKIITPPHRKIITPPHRKIIWMTRMTTIVSTWTLLQTLNRRRRSISEIRAPRYWLILARQWTSWTKISLISSKVVMITSSYWAQTIKFVLMDPKIHST